MLQGRKELAIRIALLRQKQRELQDNFVQMATSGMDTRELEEFLVTLSAEIAMLESLVAERIA